MTAKNNGTDDGLGREFVITREFDAPRELVFAAWTEQRHLAQWWGPRGFTNPVCNVDVKPGGAIHIVMRGANGAEYPMSGEFREIVAPEKLVFTSGALDENGRMLFEFLHEATFVDRNGKTAFTIRSRVVKTTAGAGKYIGGFETGMTQSLQRLGEIVLSNPQPLVVERSFDAPIASVWQALTDKTAMKQWYFDLAEFKPSVGFEFQFDAKDKGVTYSHRCVVTEVIPESKLAYSWRYEGYEGNSLVTFELFPQGDQTRLKLTHTGLESFPKLASFMRGNFAFGWNHIVGTSLKTFVEGARSEATSTADREIVISRTFDAPRELVWQAMTDPKHLVHWWGPRGFSTTIEVMDVRPGGEWKHTMCGPDGTKYTNYSIFKEVTKPRRIVYMLGGHREGGPEVSAISTWTFDTVGDGKTKVTIHMLFPTAADRDTVVREYGAIEGGKQTLERLGEHLVVMRA